MRIQLWSVGMVVGCFLPAAIAQPVTGQADSGARVRVSTNTGSVRRWTGTLVSVGEDSLRLTRRDSLVSLPLSSVEQLERSRDRHSNAGGGAVIGAVVGGGTGLVLGLLASGDDDSFYDVSPGDVMVVTLMLGAVGGGVGALIGAASHKERWEPMPLPGRPVSQGRAAAVPRMGLVLRF
jgi:hypothetical protein